MDLQMMTRQCYRMSSQIPCLNRRYLKNKIDSSKINCWTNNLKTQSFRKSYSWTNNKMENFVQTNCSLKRLMGLRWQMSKSLKMLKTLNDRMMSCCYLCLIASLKSKKTKMRNLTYSVYLTSCLNSRRRRNFQKVRMKKSYLIVSSS